CSVENHESLFAAHPLGSRLEIIRLSELCRSDACRVLKQLREVIGKHHAVEIHSDVVETAVERSLSMPGTLPGKSIKLLDAAAARASLTGAPSVTVMTLGHSARIFDSYRRNLIQRNKKQGIRFAA